VVSEQVVGEGLGGYSRPADIGLAHRGVFFLHELPEFGGHPGAGGGGSRMAEGALRCPGASAEQRRHGPVLSGSARAGRRACPERLGTSQSKGVSRAIPRQNSQRSARILKLARTIADLAGAESIETVHLPRRAELARPSSTGFGDRSDPQSPKARSRRRAHRATRVAKADSQVAIRDGPQGAQHPVPVSVAGEEVLLVTRGARCYNHGAIGVTLAQEDLRG